MASITLDGAEIHTVGEFPKAGTHAPDFTLTDGELNDVSLLNWNGQRKLLSISPSIDTSVCALAAYKLNEYARDHQDAVILVITADLPFAQRRFCAGHELENIVTLSMMRSRDFARDYGVLMEDGPMAGLAARAIVVLDENNIVVHAELVPEISQEPDYEAAMRVLGT